MSRYYAPDGSPIEPSEFGNYERQVAADTVYDANVSTVWLGIDHSWGEGTPIIFETMVFGGPYDQDQERYSTIEEARAGHERWVSKLREAGPWCGARFRDAICEGREGHEGVHLSRDYDDGLVEWFVIPNGEDGELHGP